MAKRPLPTAELLRQFVRYDSATGQLYLLSTGKPAFAYLDNTGRLRGTFRGRSLRAHRVAWCLHYGEWPKHWIDHINGDPLDNRIENMRECPNGENQKNARRRRDNTTGVTGVYWLPDERRWTARLNVGGRLLYLGRFATFEAACARRLEEQAKHGFGPMHGEA